MRALFLLACSSIACFAASPIVIGARGGVPFTAADTVASTLGGVSPTHRFVIGPTVGLRLPMGFSVEGDALFKRESLNLGNFIGVSGLPGATTHSNSWEIPIMARFTAGRGAVAPVLGAGVSVHHVNDLGSVPSFLLGNGSTATNRVGFVMGGGLRFKSGPLEITPEIRYTRWGGNSLSQSLLNILPLSRNEASFLVGFTF